MPLFGKKEEPKANPNIPVTQVLNMRAQGMNNSQIVNALRSQGYSLTQIRDALAQADIKSAVAPPELPELPPAPQAPEPENEEENLELPPLPEVPETPDLNQPPLPPQSPQLPPSPSAPSTPSNIELSGNTDQLVDELQRIIEEIIEEKWKEVEDKLNELEQWKVGIEKDVEDAKNKVKELTMRVDNFAATLAQRGESYNKTLQEVNAEMKAIEKVMGKIVPSLAEEIKELREVVEKTKKRRK